MISDFVKGRKKYDLPEPVQQGITFHRSIDEFTDNHPATIAAKQFFRPDYRLYAGAVIDVIYDHFLANDKDEFTEQSLSMFTQSVYTTLQSNFSILPESFQKKFLFCIICNYMTDLPTIYMWGLKEVSDGSGVQNQKYLTDHKSGF